jgi:hypothetical protein
MSNAELLSLMADEIATMRALANTGCALLGEEIGDVVAHLERVFDALTDDPKVMKDVAPSFMNRLRRD